MLGVSPDCAVKRFWCLESPTSRPGPQFPLVRNKAGFETFTEPSGSCLGEARFSPWRPEQPPPRPRTFPRSQGSPPPVTRLRGVPVINSPASLLPAPWALLPTAAAREGLPASLSLQSQATGSSSGSKFSQTNQASQQTGDQNNKARLRNPDSGKEATPSISPGQGAAKLGQACGSEPAWPGLFLYRLGGGG